ncbi:MAG: hypothetical protein DWQ34_10625 [Planctomycetota bacterium]|nr:MAG: hypothetical protein DWQ34_10625 [Planctomycetota bacterium]REK20739.1 MAG: hypothetical protein DWQ41_24145 [Planctomycetota bacterium]REK38078.1 MAG: hypothetical protein DWQ45_05405 [Planctomycetota bacterium]
MRTSTRLARLAAGGAAAAGAGVLAATTTRMLESGGASLGTIAAALIGAIAAAGGTLLVVAPDRWWRPLLARFDAVLSRICAGRPPVRNRAGGVLVLVGSVSYIALLTIHFPLQPDPATDDQGAYLERAQQIRTNGGVTGLLSSLFTGDFEEANRHPLYLAILSLAPTARSGQVISALIGSAALLGFTLLIARRSGWFTAGLFCILLATNGAYCRFSVRVVCEVLLVALCGAVWFAVPESDPVKPGTTGHGRHRLTRHAVIGCLLGLAYLTKGTGLLVAVGYFGWCALCKISSMWAARKSKAAWQSSEPQSGRDWWLAACTLLAFGVVASPLLVRNVRRFGNPFYNVNSLLLFADEYADFDAMTQSGTSTSEAAEAYFASHSVMDIVSREAWGLVWELFIIVRSLGPAPLDDSRAVFGVAILGGALLAILALQRARDGLLLTWGLLLWVVFAWYVPIAAGERFVLPLLIPILACAAEFLARIAGGPERDNASKLAWGAAIWAAFWVVMTGLFAATSS